MEKLAKYRDIIQNLLTDFSKGDFLGGEIESQTVFDVTSDRYLLVDLGWNEEGRIYACVLHLEIRDAKIWIQRDRTDRSLSDELLEAGVPKEDIVLGLHPPEIRQYTRFGVA